jgi:cell division protein FtsQ
MPENKRYSIKKILLFTLWVAIGTCTTVLLVAAIQKTDAAKCKEVEIKITGIENSNGIKFVDEDEILSTINEMSHTDPVGKTISSFDLKKIESALEKSKWVKNAELFFDKNNVLHVNLQEREPVARIFTSGKNSFYIDTALTILPLSERLSARLPVFTGFPSDQMVLSPADSNLLSGIKDISIAIQKDSFRMAMIEQVDITAQRNFEMIPKMGNQLIVFGNAGEAEEKFNKLELFYKEVITKTGWSKYSVINVQYNNQVVARIRGAEDKTADSVRTLQIMQVIAANAARQAEDSLQTILQDNSNNTADSSMIQQSIQRDDNFETTNPGLEQPLQPTAAQPGIKPAPPNPLPPVKPAVAKPVTSNPIPSKKPTVTKPVTVSNPKKPVVKSNQKTVKPGTQKPKAVMQSKNEY